MPKDPTKFSVQHIHNWVYNEILDALGIFDVPLTTLVDDFTVVSKTFIGKAKPGSSEAEALWQIKVLDDTGNYLKTQFAEGSVEFNKIWNNRTGYSYS